MITFTSTPIPKAMKTRLKLIRLFFILPGFLYLLASERENPQETFPVYFENDASTPTWENIIRILP